MTLEDALASHILLRRLLLGISSTVLGQVLSAAQAILFVPLFLRAWGADTYGVWLSLSAMISYLTLLDLGGQNYIGNLIASDYARGDMGAFRTKLSEGVSVSLFITLAFLALILIYLFGVSPLWPSSPRAMQSRNQETIIILLLSASLLITIPTGVYVTIYRSSGQYVRGAMVGNLARLIELVVSAGALALAVSPVGFAFVVLMCTVARGCLVFYDSYVNVLGRKGLAIGLGPAWRGRVYLKGASLFWLMSLATALNQQGVLIVLAATQGPLIVAAYATHRTAAGLVNYIGMVVQAPLWVELSHLWATGRLEEMRKIALLVLRAVTLISGLACATMWFFLPIIYPIWTGRQINFRPILLAFFLLQSVLAAAWSTTAWSLLAANRQRMPALFALANSCVTILLAVLWGRPYGLYGVALATLLGDILCGLLVYPQLANRFLELKPGQVDGTVYSTLATLVPLFLGTFCIAKYLNGGWAIVAFLALMTAWMVPAAYLAFGKEGLAQIQMALQKRMPRLG